MEKESSRCLHFGWVSLSSRNPVHSLLPELLEEEEDVPFFTS